jgi:hypothetical protein
MINAIAGLLAMFVLGGASTPPFAPEFRTDNVRYVGGELVTRPSTSPWANTLVVRPEQVRLTLDGGASLNISSATITGIAYSRVLTPDTGVVGLPAFPAPIPIFYLGWVRKAGLHYIAIDYDTPRSAQARLIIQADKKDYLALLRALNAATGRSVTMSAADRPRFPHDLATSNLDRPLLAMPGVPLWSIERLVAHASDVTAVDFSPDRGLLASASKDGTILVWDVHTRQVAWQPPKRGRGGNRVAFGPNGLLATWREWSDRITVWNAVTREFVGEVGAAKRPGAQRVVFRDDGRMMAVALEGLGRMDTTPVQFWRVPEMESAGQLTIPSFLAPISFEAGGATLVSWGRGPVAVWDTGTLASIPSPYKVGASAPVAFDTATGLLALDGKNRTVTLWDARAGIQQRAPLPTFFDPVGDTHFNADGTRLSILAGNTLLLYDVASHSALGQCLVGPIDYRSSTAISADGKHLAAASGGDHGVSVCLSPATER